MGDTERVEYLYMYMYFISHAVDRPFLKVAVKRGFTVSNYQLHVHHYNATISPCPHVYGGSLHLCPALTREILQHSAGISPNRGYTLEQDSQMRHLPTSKSLGPSLCVCVRGRGNWVYRQEPIIELELLGYTIYLRLRVNM